MTGKEQPNPNTVGLTVSDMKKTLAFYRDKLGFQMRECWPNEAEPIWASCVLDKQHIMFGQASPADACESMHLKDPAAGKFWGKKMDQFATHTHGVGVNIYFTVPDIDAYAAQVQKRGVKPDLPPTSQFYGLRDIVLTDPDGYTLTFYTPIKMSSCQSCGMPLADAQPGQMFCQYCSDEKGNLKPYEKVLEGTVTGYFMGMQKMKRPEAEKAAKEHLARMPAWATRK